ncbi:MAG: hypothetical protein ACKO1M_13840 [Planctomycetota bacterium]
MPAARLDSRSCRLGLLVAGALIGVTVPTHAADPAPADPVVSAIADRVRDLRTKPSVHDDPSAIERALAAAGVPPDAIIRLFAEVARADLPGMSPSLDIFLFLTRDPEWLALRRQFGEFLELPGVTELDTDRVAAFADYDGVVTLPDVTVLTPRSAAALAAFGEHSWGAAVELPAVGVVSPDAAAALSRCTALVALPHLRELSTDSARALSAHEGIGLVLGGLATLPPDAAAALAKTKSMQGLLLPDLESLDSEPLARRLARQDNVFLPKVTAVSVPIATALRGNEGGALVLPSLAKVPPDLARQLADAGYYWLTLGGPDTLTPEAAAILADHSGQLTLTGRLPFSAAAAGKLAAHDGLLSLPHLPELPADVARALEDHEGSLELGGVTRLTAESAAALAAHAGGVILPAVETLTPEVATALAPRIGTVVFAGVTSIDVATARALAEHCRDELALGGLTELPPDVAAALATFRGRLALPAVTTLTPDAARALAKHRGTLALESLTNLPAEIATELAKHEGDLDLHGVQSLSTAAAQALATAAEGLSLASLMNLTPEGATALLRRKGGLFVHSLQYVERIDSLPVAELLVAEFDDLELANLTALDGPQATAIAAVLARTRGSLALPSLERITPRALTALLAKKDVSLPDTEGLELLSEPGVGWTDDIVIPGR